MFRSHLSKVAVCAGLLLLAMPTGALFAAEEQAATPAQSSPRSSSEGLKLFNDHVHGILVSKCVECHGGKKVESDFDMTTREGLLKGGAYGEAVVLGKSKESLLVKAVRHVDDPHMPEGAGKLPDDMIAKIEQWIDAGGDQRRRERP
jgi:hypothetical protein